MKTLLRITAVLVLCVVVFVAGLVLLPDRHVGMLVIKGVGAITGRALHIGTVTLERDLSPRLTLSDVTFANPDWTEQDHLFEAARIDATFDMLALLSGRLHVLSFSSTGARLNLERNEAGLSSWQLSSKPRAVIDLGRLRVNKAALSDTHIAYVDSVQDRQHDLALDKAMLHSAETLSTATLEATGTIDDLPIEVTLTSDAVQDNSGTSSPQTQRTLQLDAKAGKLEFSATASLDTANQTSPLDVDISVHLRSLADVSELIGRELPPIGPLELTAHLTGDPAAVASGGLSIADFRLRVEDPLITLVAEGKLERILQDNAAAIEISLDVSDIDQTLALFDIKKRLPGSLSASASISGNGRRYDLDLQDAKLNSDVLDATLSGTVEDLLDTARAALGVSANLPDLSIVTALFGRQMPPEWGPIKAGAVLEGERGHYALNQIEAILNGESTARATGVIESLVPFDGMRLDAQANLATLAEISAFTPRPLPDLGPMIGTGVVHWQDGKLSLTDARATHRSDYGIMAVTGDIGNLVRFDGVRLRADADLPDFSVLTLFTGIELPHVDHVVASTNLISVDALDLSAHQLRMTATRDDIEIVGSGSVDSIIRGGAVLDLDLSSRVESLVQLDTLLGTTLPEVGPLTATARLTGAKREIVLSEIRATLSDEAVNATARNADDEPLRVADLSLNGLSFDVDVSMPSLAQAARRLGMTSTISAPARASGRLTSKDGELRLADTMLDVGSSRLEGDVSLRHFGDAERRTALDGDVILWKLDLFELFGAPMGLRRSGTEHTGDDEKAEKPSSNRRLLSDWPMPFELIAKDNVQLTLDIRELRSAMFDVSDAILQVAVDEGVIAIGPFSGVVNEGKAVVDLVIDTTITPPAVTIDVSLNQIDLSRAGWLDGSDQIENSGGAWLELSLTGRGNSLAEFMATASGEGGFYVEDLLFKENALSLFSSDLVDQLIDAINPSKKRKSQTRLRCTALTFQIMTGKLDTPFGLAIESDDFVIIGDAELDFRDEQLEVEFNTRPKRGLGIGLNRVANLVKLEGALASPSLSLSGSGLLAFGASVAAAIASSGATLIAEGLYEKTQANSDVCGKALGQ